MPLLVTLISRRMERNFNAENYDFGVEGLKYWDLGAGSYLTDGKAAMGSGKNITERLFALYARANYSYNDKYMVSATIRHEGSSKFAAENRWGNFWALSGGLACICRGSS